MATKNNNSTRLTYKSTLTHTVIVTRGYILAKCCLSCPHRHIIIARLFFLFSSSLAFNYMPKSLLDFPFFD